MMYSWEKKFGDVVRDTERHLSKARDTLDSSGHKRSYTSLFDDSSKGRQQYTSEIRQVTVLPAYSSSRQVQEYPSDKSHGAYQLYSRSHDESGGMVALLSEKIDRQGKLIEDLTRQVLTLEREGEKGSVRIRSLEQEVTSLRQRMSEDGVHLQTEQKVDQFQWEMKGKLEELRCQLEIQNRLEAPVNHDWRHAVTKELHELKRQVERECDALHREIEVIRSKLIRYDVDLTGQQGDTKELARRLEKLKEDFQVNASKVSVQMNSLSNVAQTPAGSRNGWLTHNSNTRSPWQPASSPDNKLPKEKNRRRKKKNIDQKRNRAPSLGTTSTVRSSSAWSGEDLKRGALSLSSSSGDFSSDSDPTSSRPSTVKEVASTKVTDNSLTLSDLDSRSDSPLGSSRQGFAALSLDSDSLDLEDL